MRSFLFSLMLVLAAGSLPAQALSKSLPADTMAYIYGHGGLDALQKMFGAGDIWSSPIDTDQILAQADKGLSLVEGMLGFETGSLMGYIKSLQSMEAALFQVELTDDIPNLDFAVVLQLPQADKLYELLSGSLVKRQIADLNDQKELEITTDEFGLNVAQRGDRIIVAGSQDRLRKTMDSLGQVRAGSLAQQPAFKFVQGELAPHSFIYVNLKPFIRMALQAIPSGGRIMAVSAMGLLGVRKLKALGLAENDLRTRFSLKASGKIPLLQVFSGAPGTPELLAGMPAGTAFGLALSSDLGMSWKKAKAILLADESPLAPFVESGIQEFENTTGLKADDLAQVAKGGVAFGMLPDTFGNLDDDGFFACLRLEDPESALDFVRRALPVAAKKSRSVLEESGEGSTTWFKILRKNSRRARALLVFQGHYAVIGGQEAALRAVLASLNGQAPTLADSGVLKGLPSKAEGYLYLGLKAVMSNSRELSPFLSRLKDGAGIAASVNVKKDSVVLATNKPLSKIFGAFGSAASYFESVKAKRAVHRKNLVAIGKAYKAYVEAHGKAPNSYGELGLSGEKALFGPLVDGKRQPGSEIYVLMPTTPHENDWNFIQAYCQDSRFGRMVLSPGGYARPWSEAAFQKQLAAQKKIPLKQSR